MVASDRSGECNGRVSEDDSILLLEWAHTRRLCRCRTDHTCGTLVLTQGNAKSSRAVTSIEMSRWDQVFYVGEHLSLRKSMGGTRRKRAGEDR